MSHYYYGSRCPLCRASTYRYPTHDAYRHMDGSPLCVPDYATAILAEAPLYGLTFTTSDGVRMEWATDMATGDSGYCQID